MSFRIEEKYRLNEKKVFFFKKWLDENNAQKLFPRRKITSIYFDNKKKQMYHESIQGLVPRYKLRLRYYNDKESDVRFEKKINSAEGKFKTSVLNLNLKNYLKFGYHDKIYGTCKPILKISYFREYYFIFGKRVTLDQEILYQKILPSGIDVKKEIKDNKIIVEFKDKLISYDSNISKKIYFEKIRFSKYCRAVEKIFKEVN